MKKLVLSVPLFALSISAAAQSSLPIVGDLTASLTQLGGLSGLPMSSSSGISLDFVQDLVAADMLGLGSIATELQSMGAPFAGPLLITVAPLIDAGPVLPLLPEIPF